MEYNIKSCLFITSMLVKHLSNRLYLSNCVRTIHLSCQLQKYVQSRNPKDPHYDRKRMIEICKPIFIAKKLPDWETCSKVTLVEEEKAHPYEMILAKELKQNWDSSEMIMFYHLFSLTDRQKRDIRNMFYKENLFFHICSPEVVKLAVRDTPFTSIQHLFESNTALLFSPDKDIDKILQLSKTTPNAILMAGIVENKFLSRTQLQKLNDALKTDGHQVLAQFLDSVPSHIVGTISHHQRMLTHLLSQVTNIKN